MADTPEQNSLAAEFEQLQLSIDELRDIVRNQGLVIRSLQERTGRLELYNYRLQSSLVDLSRQD